MAKLSDVNAMIKAGVSEFRLESFENGSGHLLIVGSFDLCYYHDVELHFREVTHINCPTDFSDPSFHVARGGHSYRITCDDGDFNVCASSVDVVIGKVYYYDRGLLLKAGERIASWVRKGSVPEGL